MHRQLAGGDRWRPRHLQRVTVPVTRRCSGWVRPPRFALPLPSAPPRRLCPIERTRPGQDGRPCPRCLHAIEDRARAVCCRHRQHPLLLLACCKPRLPASCKGRYETGRGAPTPWIEPAGRQQPAAWHRWMATAVLRHERRGELLWVADVELRFMTDQAGRGVRLRSVPHRQQIVCHSWI